MNKHVVVSHKLTPFPSIKQKRGWGGNKCIDRTKAASTESGEGVGALKTLGKI